MCIYEDKYIYISTSVLLNAAMWHGVAWRGVGCPPWWLVRTFGAVFCYCGRPLLRPHNKAWLGRRDEMRCIFCDSSETILAVTPLDNLRVPLLSIRPPVAPSCFPARRHSHGLRRRFRTLALATLSACPGSP